MPFVNVNDINLYYEQHGAGEDLILIAGYSADHTTWTNVVEILSKRFRVTIFDNRGAGQSDAPEGLYHLEQMSQDVAGLMDALHIEKAHILGHSMGVKIAIQLVLTCPEKVNKLILVSGRAEATGFPTRWLSQINKELLGYNLPAELIIRNMAPWLYAGVFLENKEKSCQELDRALVQSSRFTEIGKRGQLAAAGIDLLPKCQQIQVATLVVHGDEDVLILPKLGMKIAQAIPNAKFHLIDNCGHMPPIETPAELTHLVTTFITNEVTLPISGPNMLHAG